MNQPLLMGVLQGEGRLVDIVGGAGRRDALLVLEDGGQTGALDELHDEEMAAGLLLRVVGLDDAGVTELGQRLGFAAEAHDSTGVVDAPLRQHLDGDAAVQLGVVPQVNLAHAALAQFVQQLVATELRQTCRIGLCCLVAHDRASRMQGAGGRENPPGRPEHPRPIANALMMAGGTVSRAGTAGQLITERPRTFARGRSVLRLVRGLTARPQGVVPVWPVISLQRVRWFGWRILLAVCAHWR